MYLYYTKLFIERQKSLFLVLKPGARKRTFSYRVVHRLLYKINNTK